MPSEKKTVLTEKYRNRDYETEIWVKKNAAQLRQMLMNLVHVLAQEEISGNRSKKFRKKT